MTSVTGNAGVTQGGSVSLRCPCCRHVGTFHSHPNCHDLTWQDRANHSNLTSHAGGLRICPNPQCRALVFVHIVGGRLVEAFPPEVIDFDSTNLPDKVLSSLEEAVKAHAAGCFRASALMVRRVLEELCADKQATGKNLKDRIKSLGNIVLVPAELFEAADELRILGNEAAHVEAQEYDQVGKDEAKLAIDLAKELLKSVYQYGSLVSRLRALKKP